MTIVEDDNGDYDNNHDHDEIDAQFDHGNDNDDVRKEYRI